MGYNRNSMRGCLGIWVISWLGLALCAGCQQQSEDQHETTPEGPLSGGTVIVAFPAEPDVLNSLIYASAYSGQILSLLQDSMAEMVQTGNCRKDIAVVSSKNFPFQQDFQSIFFQR